MFIENPPKLADGDSYGVEPRELERSFEIKTFRKEGEEIHPSGNEHIPPHRQLLKMGFLLYRWVFLFVLLRVNSWITLIFS